MRGPAGATGNGWSIDDALELYQIPAWGQGYFAINARGNLVVRPDTTAQHDRELALNHAH